MQEGAGVSTEAYLVYKELMNAGLIVTRWGRNIQPRGASTAQPLSWFGVVSITCQLSPLSSVQETDQAFCAICRHPALWIVPKAYEGHKLEGHALLPAVETSSPPPSKRRRLDDDNRCADPQLAAVVKVQVEAISRTCCSSL